MIARIGILLTLMFCASVLRGDVVKVVKSFLIEQKIELGYDADAESCVLIGRASQIVNCPVSSPNFLVARNVAVKKAERNARAAIMKVVASRAKGERTVELESDGESKSKKFQSIVDVFSNEPLHGCETVCVREEKDGEWIRVAVAMKWSAAAEAEATAAKRGDIDLSELSEEDEWTSWAETFDFDHAGSSASFTGTDGIRRWVGIGYADIEGKQGVSATAAMRVARQTAGAELAYALFGEAETQAIAKRLREENSSGSGEKETITADEFENMVSLSVKGKSVQDSEVYTTTIVHPLSGRKLFVSVAGIEPSDLAEMNLLGVTGRGGASGSGAEYRGRSTGRPDHGARPASNRPDHGARPASNRPEHLE